jgi:hypothetical protein
MTALSIINKTKIGNQQLTHHTHYNTHKIPFSLFPFRSFSAFINIIINNNIIYIIYMSMKNDQKGKGKREKGKMI